MVVGDHGEAFGQHPANAGHSLFIYDENVHVPWLVSVPGRTAGAHVHAVRSLVDVPSTLVELAGLPRHPADQGVGLRTRPDPIALFFTDYSLELAGLRDGCWTYLYESDADRSQLFDVCRDPGQSHDRSRDEPARTTAYRERLETAILGRSGNMVGQR
jgi:arylsulfatase A-like enzyme